MLRNLAERLRLAYLGIPQPRAAIITTCSAIGLFLGYGFGRVAVNIMHVIGWR